MARALKEASQRSDPEAHEPWARAWLHKSNEPLRACESRHSGTAALGHRTVLPFQLRGSASHYCHEYEIFTERLPVRPLLTPPTASTTAAWPTRACAPSSKGPIVSSASARCGPTLAPARSPLSSTSRRPSTSFT